MTKSLREQRLEAEVKVSKIKVKLEEAKLELANIRIKELEERKK